MSSQVTQQQMANAIRALAMDAVQKCGSGHPGMPMGAADMATALFTRHLKFNPKDPHWADRDRFVLSAGHGSMLIYALLYLTGYEDIDLEDIKNLRTLGAKTAGHPEYGHVQGVETTTGPLGQGICNAVGMAIAEAKLAAEFGEDLVNHYTYVIVGDGCLMEGISQEAIALAGHQQLNKLIVLWDDNETTIDGSVNISDSTDQLARFEASGWDSSRVDGHDQDAVSAAIEAAKKSNTPSLIACRTTIGYGAPNKQGTREAHGAALGEEEIAATRQALDWPHAPFDIPQDILDAWRLAALKAARAHAEWQERVDAADTELRGAFTRRMRAELGTGLDTAILAHKQKLAEQMPNIATRKASQMALDVINKVVAETMGGSADLTGSNLTQTDGMEVFCPTHRAGRYIHYGVREHAMAATMNGMAAHGGLIPYGGTFLVFSDYCRPAIRLSALMMLRVIYVMTHDSIGVGEDGPTHQPVEHVACLRAIPNLHVYRPADAMETAECWQLAIERDDGPSVLCLSRQGLPAVRAEADEKNLCARGAYIMADEDDADITLFASGSEVSLAFNVRDELAVEGKKARIVSVPCMEVFEAQPEAYKKDILGTSGLNVALEAGIDMPWQRFIGPDGLFFGMNHYGASGAASDLFSHFGLTGPQISARILEHLGDA